MTQDTPSILLIGAGNIGKRTLQSLLKMLSPSAITVVDPSEASLNAAHSAAEELNDVSHHHVTYNTAIPPELLTVDLAIIATSAAPRFAILKDMLMKVRVKSLILEKFLFQKREHYAEAEQLLAQHNIPCWVSCPRPVWPGYESLHKNIGGRSGNVMVVSGGAWNMASNAIHLLDCFSRISEEKITSLSGQGLETKPFANKRAGNLEVSGQLTARGSNGGTATLICTQETGLPLRVFWFSKGERYFINEGGQIIKTETAEGTTSSAFPILMASQLTPIYTQILAESTCGLSRFQQAAQLHLDLIDILNPIFLAPNEQDQPCPVT